MKQRTVRLAPVPKRLRLLVAAALTLFLIPAQPLSAGAATPQDIVEFWLVDATSDTRIHQLFDYDSVRLPLVPDELSIEAVADGDADSVIMRIEGVVSATENNAPYALGSDVGGDFFPVPELKVPGWIQISAQPFDGPNGTDDAGTETVLHLYLDQPDFVVNNPADAGDYDPGDGWCSVGRPPFVADDFAFAHQSELPKRELDRILKTTPAPAPATGRQSAAATALAGPGEPLETTPPFEPTIDDFVRPGWIPDHACTLRAAIEEANALNGRQRILIDSAKGPFVLSKGQLEVTDGVDIMGYGSRAVIDAEKRSRVFDVRGDHIINMSMLEVANGKTKKTERGGGLSIDDDALVQMFDSVVRGSQANFGGGIYLEGGGDLLLVESAIRDNIAGTPEDGIDGGGQTQRGGGIFNNRGIVTIRRSAIFDNLAVRGGGISNYGGTLRIEDSSVIDNEALAIGGGIENKDNLGQTGVLHLSFSTVAHNMAGTSVKPPADKRVGGGIYNLATAFMASTILADNTDAYGAADPLHAPDCYSPEDGGFLSYRNNLVGVLGTYCGLEDYSWGNTGGINFGTEGSPLDPELTNKFPADHRHFRNIHANSPAVDAGGSAGAIYPCGDLDGRDNPRPVGAGCDIGAIERQ